MKPTYICAILLPLPLLLLGSAFVGCGDDDDDAVATNGTSGASGSSSGTSGAGGQGGSGAGQGGGGAGQGGAGGGAAGGGAGQGGVGTRCGGRGGLQCDSTTYCDYPLNDCGASDGQGECKPRPQGCNNLYAPVCTCGGTVAGNECGAYAAGTDIASNGNCMAPDAGLFACGEKFCHGDTEYCQRSTSDVGGEPTTYACRLLPDGCGDVGSCDCLDEEPCAELCEPTNGGITLTCPGG